MPRPAGTGPAATGSGLRPPGCRCRMSSRPGRQAVRAGPGRVDLIRLRLPPTPCGGVHRGTASARLGRFGDFWRRAAPSNTAPSRACVAAHRPPRVAAGRSRRRQPTDAALARLTGESRRGYVRGTLAHTGSISCTGSGLRFVLSEGRERALMLCEPRNQAPPSSCEAVLGRRGGRREQTNRLDNRCCLGLWKHGCGDAELMCISYEAANQTPPSRRKKKLGRRSICRPPQWSHRLVCCDWLKKFARF